jgi:hypothetical protein
MRPNRRRNLQISKKSVPLHRVFHSIRFKVNKRLEQGVAPFFFANIENKKKEQLMLLFSLFILLYTVQWFELCRDLQI